MTADMLLSLARAQGALIATAESCTAGLIAGAITEVAGSSAIFDRGFVTYSNAAKMQMLGVRAKTLDAVGAVSEEVACEMAEGALARSDATLAVAVTGIAGPGGSEFKPEGRVCFGLAQTGAQTQTELVDFGAIGRSEVRAATVAHALSLLVSALNVTPSETAAPDKDRAPQLTPPFVSGLLGQTVQTVSRTPGAVIVTLSDGSDLTITTACTLSHPNHEAYRGERISHVVARPDAFLIRLAGGQEIVVGLSERDLRGPEPMRLHSGADQIIVWP